MNNEEANKIVNRIYQETQQQVSYQLQDLIDSHPEALREVVLAAIMSNVNAIISVMDEKSRNLVNDIVEQTEVRIFPKCMDPRRDRP